MFHSTPHTITGMDSKDFRIRIGSKNNTPKIHSNTYYSHFRMAPKKNVPVVYVVALSFEFILIIIIYIRTLLSLFL